MIKKIQIKGLTVNYGAQDVISNLDLDIYQNEVLAIIGPANSGKSSLLRCLNRMVEFNPQAHVKGEILLDNENIYQDEDSTFLRRRIGMVSPLPVGLPMSIKDNVTYAPRMAGCKDQAELDYIMEDCLKKAALWDEVKDRLDGLATKLSGGQQQRLTIARALSHHPEVLCLDEFSIAIDPVTTMKIEAVLSELKKQMTIVMVTNVISQARRLGDRTAMMLHGKILDLDTNENLFNGKVKDSRTQDYIEGLFG
ncbi:phosphate ABC transporter ATP-binding protein [Peredibacter sp. HCB2-198]|uniref:phosphate ABC transporter ATP-binding protein n=1 Tax=Peredibacter sp. HCB2-198 TaxID=3383025 RepID=UPI0038B69F97